MKPKSIKYNGIFEVIKENDEGIVSERRSKKDTPIFDIEKGKGCSIEISKNNEGLILFYKSGIDNPSYYKSFARFKEQESIFFFGNFSEIVKDKNGKGVKKF